MHRWHTKVHAYGAYMCVSYARVGRPTNGAYMCVGDNLSTVGLYVFVGICWPTNTYNHNPHNPHTCVWVMVIIYINMCIYVFVGRPTDTAPQTPPHRHSVCGAANKYIYGRPTATHCNILQHTANDDAINCLWGGQLFLMGTAALYRVCSTGLR